MKKVNTIKALFIRPKRLKQNNHSQTHSIEDYYENNNNIIKINRWKKTVFVNRRYSTITFILVMISKILCVII